MVLTYRSLGLSPSRFSLSCFCCCELPRHGQYGRVLQKRSIFNKQSGTSRLPVLLWASGLGVYLSPITCTLLTLFRPLFLAPLSEVFGRRPIYCVSIFLYFIFMLPSMLAKNAATLVVARMIAGLCVGGTIIDVWAVENRGVPIALFSGTLL